MLINISYKNGLFYIWGVTDQIDSNDGQKYIEAEKKILYSIAEKCATNKAYVSNVVSIDVVLPAVDETIDVTGKSDVLETFTTNAYTIPVNRFLAYAPTRIKKEFPKKTFVNVHLSNGFVLTHLLMRIVNELFEAREYYPYFHVDADHNLKSHWRAHLNGDIEFYICKIIHSLPQTFFILSDDSAPNYYAFVRQMIDDAMQAYMVSVADNVDKKTLKKRADWPLLEQLLTQSPEPIQWHDTQLVHTVMAQEEKYFNDNFFYEMLIKFVADSTDPNLLHCHVNVFHKITLEELDIEEIYSRPDAAFFDLLQINTKKDAIALLINLDQPVHVSQMADMLEIVKKIQMETGCKVSLPKGMTHVTVAPKAEIIVETAEFTDDTSLFSPAAISNIKWHILLGDTPVTLEELQRLADENQTHYMSAETLIPINVDQLHEFLRQVKKIQKQKITPFDLLRADAGFGIQYNVSSGWLERVLKQLRGQTPIKELDQPQGLKANLRPYQVRGYSWLCFMRDAGLGACLADDMGLGKTIQTISYMLHVRKTNRHPKKPFLLVCPTSLLSNWQRELETFAPELNFHVHHGSARDKENDFFETDIVITSYSLADRDLSFLKPQLWEGIILDEAQNIKNANAKQTRALKMLNARHRIILTGTPIENRPTDIWSLMDFANHGLLGNKTWFNSHYGRALSYSNKKEQQEQAEKVAQQLKGIVAPFMLRRLKTDNSIISDLPDRINHKIVCKLSLEQTSLYKACVDNMLSELNQTKDGLARRGLILTTLMRLKQICNHPAQFTKQGLAGESGKLDVLRDLLSGIIENDEKVLIFTQFKEMGTILSRILEKELGKHIPFLNGSTPAKDRGQMVEDFQQENGSSIFILSLKAGGIGLNLTAANHVIHYDRWWNPAVEDQATSRAHRIGQKKIVSVHTFICNGTIEDRIDAMIEQKITLAKNVVGEGEGWITELSDAQLKDLFTLKEVA